MKSSKNIVFFSFNINFVVLLNIQFYMFKKIPKADLHIHLNGAIPFITIDSLVKDSHIAIDNFNYPDDLFILKPVHNLQSYFKPWDLIRLLPTSKTNLELMIAGCLDKLSKDNVNYVEVRNSIIYVAKLNKIALEEAVDWHIEALEKFSLIYDIDARLIISVRRELDQLNEYYKILEYVKSIKSDRVVGFDLTGNETNLIHDGISHFFHKVKEAGFGVTIHAGETWLPENIKYAVEECFADRIGHGLAIENDYDLVTLLIENDICIEVCLTSNLLTSSVKDIKDHPIFFFIRENIPFVLCSDNPTIHNKTLTDEYNLFYQISQNSDIFNWMYEKQNQYAFRKR